MLSIESVNTLRSLDRPLGEAWYRHQLKANASDELLSVIIADGTFSTKIDGFIHAASMTTPFIIKHAEEVERVGFDPLDLEHVTSWEPTDSAVRYAHWQVDFHWRIDTRAWQYNLLAKFMRRSYEEVVLAAGVLTPEDRRAFLSANISFWDAVEVVFQYQYEIIERARRFAPHPDQSAGARDHGYIYRPLVASPYYPFDKLHLEITGPDLGAGTADQSVTPTGFPCIPNVTYDETTEAIRVWVRAAQKAGICDDYLRVALGDRQVPTRVNGWTAAIDDLQRYIFPEPTDPMVQEVQTCPSSDISLARFFALTQLEFDRRLNGGGSAGLRKLLDTARPALDHLLPSETQRATAQRFLTQVQTDLTGRGPHSSDGFADLIDLVRPIHPRYAAYDPHEPLPWHIANPGRYANRMARLGYEL